MKTLEKFLSAVVDTDLRSVIMSVAYGVVGISKTIASADNGKSGGTNVFGEEQLALDVLTNDVLTNELKLNSLIGIVASEELPEETLLGDGEFGVCYDPLDGSSLVDVNLAIGTIVGIYKTDTFVGITGRDQLASLCVIYGPRTTMLITVGDGVFEFKLSGEEFILSRDDIFIKEGKMFAPGNMRACKENEMYAELVNFWIMSQYNLRYSGGMAPDVAQIFLKGKGVFAFPGDSLRANGKLRLIFECAPLAFLVEQAGGSSSDGKKSILDIVSTGVEHCTPVYLGSKEEVARCEKYLA